MPPQKKPFIVETKFPRRLAKNQTPSIWNKAEFEKLSAEVDNDCADIIPATPATGALDSRLR